MKYKEWTLKYRNKGKSFHLGSYDACYMFITQEHMKPHEALRVAYDKIGEDNILYFESFSCKLTLLDGLP